MKNKRSWIKRRVKRLLYPEPRTQAELIETLHQAQLAELIDCDALQMIEGVLAVSEKKVRDAMVPRSQMVVLDPDASAESVLPTVMQSRHSRFPVSGSGPESVLGVLLAKDLLPCVSDPLAKTRLIRELLRPAILIPESKRLDVLLKEFRQSQQHMAIVMDEYGAVSGLITIEDVLEEIVGDIRDEYDKDESESQIKKLKANTYLVSGLTPIEAVNRYFHTHFDHTSFDTIGGLVIQKFSYLPKRSEKIKLGPFEINVLKATRRGVLTLEFTRKTKHV